jgi:hypothetical protein
MHAHTFALTAVLALAGGAHAQVMQPIPADWPLGGWVPSVLVNDGTTPIPYSPCTPWVTDQNGNIVSFGICAAVELLLAPGEVATSYWTQADEFGQQVVPGLYHVNGVPYSVGNTGAALLPLGPPRTGFERHLELSAPSQPNAPYVLAASASSLLGIDLGCSRTFPLDFDALLVASLTNTNVFKSFIGTLDANGRTSEPSIAVPANPALVGITFELAFMTFDFSAPCGVGVVSAPYVLTVN